MGWEIGQTSRSDWADPTESGVPEWDKAAGKTWYLRVSPRGRLQLVVANRRLPGMLWKAMRPLSEFPASAVEEGIARIAVETDKSWP
jgi:hypothetical protein